MVLPTAGGVCSMCSVAIIMLDTYTCFTCFTADVDACSPLVIDSYPYNDCNIVRTILLHVGR